MKVFLNQLRISFTLETRQSLSLCVFQKRSEMSLFNLVHGDHGERRKRQNSLQTITIPS